MFLFSVKIRRIRCSDESFFPSDVPQDTENLEDVSEILIGFNIPYNLENSCFTDAPLTVSAFYIGIYRIVASMKRIEISEDVEKEIKLVKKVGKTLTNKHLIKAWQSRTERGDVKVYDRKTDRAPKENGLEEKDVKEEEIVEKKKIFGKAKTPLKKSRRKQKKTQ